MNGLGYSIKVVSRLTGLTPHVIRIWEKRYSAVTPDRTSTNRRLYSDVEVERLTLLRRATEAGHSIRNIASIPTAKLRQLVRPEEELPALPHSAAPTPSAAAKQDHLEDALRAIRALDAVALDRIFNQAAVELSQPALIQELIVPLIHKIGTLWEAGQLKIIHEHIASASIRTFMGNFMRQHSTPGFAPTIVVTTPAGQVHELGAILAAAEANNHGWRVCYLGPSLPAEEIAAAAIQQKARAVALSIVYPTDDPHLAGELKRLHQLLPNIVLLVGGRACHAYQPTLDEIGAAPCHTIAEFGAQLARHRLHRNSPS